MHDYTLFMANTGLRPDEANWLEYRDVTIEKDDESDEPILLTKCGQARLWLLQKHHGRCTPV
ncbi:hypothetical protein [Agrobacterium tumefaciens]|uniref:hypothetical protein n=1 Tax=Agrobacterium tumefaciens TaxID=358 RepID=UPI001F1E14E1|nr:hypothetical protein [Agrobacterium tumefaciens]